MRDREALQANIAAQQAQTEINRYTAHAISRSDTIGQVFGFLVCLAAVGGANETPKANPP